MFVHLGILLLLGLAGIVGFHGRGRRRRAKGLATRAAQTDGELETTRRALANVRVLLDRARERLEGHGERLGAFESLVGEGEESVAAGAAVPDWGERLSELREDAALALADLNEADSVIREREAALVARLEGGRIDPLTQVANRQEFEERLDYELELIGRYGGTFSLLLLDVDRIGEINERLGYDAGDRVLVGIAAVTRGCVRGTDLVARFGGEEFCVLLPKTPAERAGLAAERIRRSIERTTFWHGDQPIRVTVSIGVTDARVADRVGRLIARADGALTAAKEAGRNRVEVRENADPAAAGSI